jgi:hypothetical protein
MRCVLLRRRFYKKHEIFRKFRRFKISEIPEKVFPNPKFPDIFEIPGFSGNSGIFHNFEFSNFQNVLPFVITRKQHVSPSSNIIKKQHVTIKCMYTVYMCSTLKELIQRCVNNRNVFNTASVKLLHLCIMLLCVSMLYSICLLRRYAIHVLLAIHMVLSNNKRVVITTNITLTLHTLQVQWLHVTIVVQACGAAITVTHDTVNTLPVCIGAKYNRFIAYLYIL